MPEPADTERRRPGPITLSDIAGEDPQAAFRRFMEITLRLCNAGSAGLSLLRLNAAGQAVIRWEAVSGALSGHEGNEVPRESSPCGACLEAAATTILPDPQRAYPFLRSTQPWISEDVMVPLYDDSKTPIGTLWIAHHGAEARFGSADVVIAQQLATLLQRVLGSFERETCRLPLALLEAHEMERCAAARDLAAERGRREQAEAAASKLRAALVFKNVEIDDAHHRVKNTLQIAASFLQLQATNSRSVQTCAALQEAYRRLHLLADVHEQLYKGDNEARKIPMRNLLQTVAETLEVSFLERAAQVQLRTAIEPIMLTAEDAIPLASLANEAITNAYKYAFPGLSGEITVTLQRTAKALVLQISDNGIGLPASVDKRGFGRRLMERFAAQLGGTLVFTRPAESSGTAITLTIPDHAGPQESLG